MLFLVTLLMIVALVAVIKLKWLLLEGLVRIVGNIIGWIISMLRKNSRNISELESTASESSENQDDSIDNSIYGATPPQPLPLNFEDYDFYLLAREKDIRLILSRIEIMCENFNDDLFEIKVSIAFQNDWNIVKFPKEFCFYNLAHTPSALLEDRDLDQESVHNFVIYGHSQREPLESFLAIQDEDEESLVGGFKNGTKFYIYQPTSYGEKGNLKKSEFVVESYESIAANLQINRLKLQELPNLEFKPHKLKVCR